MERNKYMSKISLIIPCYNEALRINFNEFKNFKDIFFLFVNDGSTDNTFSIINNNLSENISLLNLSKNVGKGEAIRQGITHLKTLPIYNQTTWIGFWDADLSTPLDEAENFIKYAELQTLAPIAVFGSRITRLGSNIHKKMYRRILGVLFQNFANKLLSINCYDSQCGAKLFKKEIIDLAFNQPFISPWLFDLEIIKRLKNYNLVEYPLNSWVHKDGSKIKIHKLFLRVIWELLKIKKNEN